MKLKNKRILLTGADGGIGSSIAKQLYYQGCKLILVGISEGPLEKLNQQMENHHEVIAADLSTDEGRQKLFDKAEELGGIDGLINNAGIMDFSFIGEQSSKKLEALISINLVSPMILCQMFVPMLKVKPESFILNMGSTFGSIGYPGFSAYSASKFGMRGYTETLRRELSDSNVQVMYLAPRGVKTPINSPAIVEMNEKLGSKMDDPSVVSSAVLTMLNKGQDTSYLGWPEKLFVKVNGIFPKIVDKALGSKLSIIREFAKQANK